MVVSQGFGDGGSGRDGHDRYDDDHYENDEFVASEEELEQLDLADEDEPLPWLESDYDDEEESGVDTGRLIGFILLSLVVLGLILAAAWYFLRDRPDPDLLPEGATIEAPDGPVKERPEDAGGKTFEGTGNVAPGVGEGETTEGRLDDGNGTSGGEDANAGGGEEAPRPSIDAATGAGSAGNAAGSVGVQVGAYSSRESAVAAWGTLRGQTDALNGFSNRIVEGEVDGGKVYRLQAVAGDEAAAERLCNALKGDGIACQVKR